MNLEQTETFYFVTKNALVSSKRPRLSLPHMSTAGTILGPMGFPDLADRQATWHLSLGDKKKIYGTARIQPSGASPDGAVPEDSKREKRSDKTIEPVTFHASSVQMMEELLYQVAPYGQKCVGQARVKAVVDLTPGDGTLATVCLKHGIPYLGLVFNEYHQEVLTQRLAQVVFQLFLDEKSPLHDATLCSLLRKKSSCGSQEEQTNGTPETPEKQKSGSGGGTQSSTTEPTDATGGSGKSGTGAPGS